MNKKLKGILLTAAILAQAALPAFSASAEEAGETIPVHVTISEAGTLRVTDETVQVADRDGDGSYTIDEALYAAHEAFYEGGAAAGYASEATDWGLSVKTLWGVTNGGNYGYYVNNASAMGLTDTLKAGDYLGAFTYKDLESWSDHYCYFDVNEITDAKQGEEKTLTLLQVAYDENWAPVSVPAAGAFIVINGEKTAFQTDENGAVTVKFDQAGDLILSAVSGTETLAPPALRVKVAAAEVTSTTVTEATTAEAAGTTTTTTAKSSTGSASSSGTSSSSSSSSAAKTGESAAIPALSVTAVLACGAAFALRRRND